MPAQTKTRRSRSRGAQPGNRNALKHGFYSAHFTKSERRLLDQLPPTDLTAEIELIRITAARFLAALRASKGALDYEASLAALRAVNLSAQSIATLLRLQSLTVGDAQEALKAIEELETREVPPEEGATDPWRLIPAAHTEQGDVRTESPH